MSEGVLAVRDLSVPFGTGPGLTGISWQVRPGERLALVGASGAGKTSLLRAVAGLLTPTAGRITVGARDVTGLPPEARGIVYLHQAPLLFPHRDVAGNVAFPLEIRGADRTTVAAEVRQALAAVHLEPLAGRRPDTLSGGQRHRVALARAAVARPAALLLDEPLAALDPVLRAEIRDALLALLARYRPAVVLVTHDFDEAALLGDRVGVLLGGRLAQVAPPGELFRRPASLAVARFLGLPNAIPGRVDEAGTFRSALGVLAVDGAVAPGAAVAVGSAAAFRLDPAGPVHAIVTAVHPGAGRATARVRAGGLELATAVDALDAPAPGTAVRLAVDPRHLTLVPDDA